MHKNPIAGHQDISEKTFKRQAHRDTRADFRASLAAILKVSNLEYLGDADIAVPSKLHGDQHDGPKRGKTFVEGITIRHGRAGRHAFAKRPMTDPQVEALARMRK